MVNVYYVKTVLQKMDVMAKQRMTWQFPIAQVGKFTTLIHKVIEKQAVSVLQLMSFGMVVAGDENWVSTKKLLLFCSHNSLNSRAAKRATDG